MAEIVVVGSMIIDLTTYLPGPIPDYGSCASVDNFGMDFGGNGANQAVMPRLLGAEVALVGKVGNDAFGKMYCDHLKNLGIDVAHIAVSDAGKTGASQIIVHESSGQYAAIGYLGANLHLTLEDVQNDQALLSTAKCLLISLESPFDATLEALRIANQGGATCLFNASPTPYIERLRASNNDYENYLRLASVICLNEFESAALCGEALPAGCQDQDDATFRTVITRFVEQIHNETSRVGNNSAIVLTTLGRRGVAFWNEDLRRVEFVETDCVQAVDSTGAGDCFVGSLAYFIVRHPALPIREKIRRAARIATVSVTRRGTQTSYPKRAELPEDLFL